MNYLYNTRIEYYTMVGYSGYCKVIVSLANPLERKGTQMMSSKGEYARAVSVFQWLAGNLALSQQKRKMKQETNKKSTLDQSKQVRGHFCLLRIPLPHKEGSGKIVVVIEAFPPALSGSFAFGPMKWEQQLWVTPRSHSLFPPLV